MGNIFSEGSWEILVGVEELFARVAGQFRGRFFCPKSKRHLVGGGMFAIEIISKSCGQCFFDENNKENGVGVERSREFRRY